MELDFSKVDFVKLRKLLGKSQVAVAREVGVSISAYVHWEQHVAYPKEEYREKLAKALGL